MELMLFVIKQVNRNYLQIKMRDHVVLLWTFSKESASYTWELLIVNCETGDCK